ncbi:hypothetical protein L950_0201355 [Sphingobacterium sp. IITKGP-BTPF85]|nr:hypothetical protein L950_0201355 [Sphingobacterium sp. IITKGP-BTPF85]
MIQDAHIIIHAARVGNIEVLEELIRQKADLNSRDDKGYSPLIIACYNNQYQAAKLLLNSGAHVNAQDNGGNTALMGAAFKGYKDIAELLISTVQILIFSMEMVALHLCLLPCLEEMKCCSFYWSAVLIKVFWTPEACR